MAAQNPNSCPPGFVRAGSATAPVAVVPLASGLWSHIRSVNDLIPEVAQLDSLVFEGTFTSATSITQPTDIKIPTGYYFDMYGVQTYLEEPGLAVANLVAMSWNVSEVGKRSVFGTDQRFAQTQNIYGPCPPVFFPRSLYLFSPGSTAKVTLSWNSARTFNGGAKLVGVCLLGGLIARDKIGR